MKRLKIVAQIILLILSVINFTLAVPIVVRGIREVRVDVVDVAEDVTTPSRKRWNPSDKWWKNKADRANTPAGLGSSGPDHRLEQELWPHDARSPMDSNASPQSSAGPSQQPTGSDNPHPLPVGPPPPAHNNLPGLDASPQPSQGPTDSDNSHPQAVPEGPPLPHNNWPDLNPPPQFIQELADSSNAGGIYSEPSTDSDAGFYPGGSSAKGVYDDSASSLQDSLNHPAIPGPTDDQPPPAPSSDPGSSKRPYSPSDPGPSKRPYNPSDPGPSTSAPPPPDPEPSNWGPTLSDPGVSERPYSPSGSGPSWSTWAHDPGLPAWADPPSSSGPLQDESETFLGELFKGTGRLKRRISGSRLVNAA